VCFGFFVSPASAQTASTAPTRDPQAVLAIQNSIVAMGGTSAIAAIQDSTVQGTQTYDSMPDRQPVAFTWKTSGDEYYSTAQDEYGVYSTVTGHGAPAELKNGKWSLRNSHMVSANLPFYMPILVLQAELQNPNYTFQLVGTSVVEGQQAIHVHAVDNSDSVGQLVTSQEWYFDPSSSLPVRLEYKSPSPGNPNYSVPASFEYRNFQVVNGVAVPFQLKIQDWQLHITVNVASVSFNSGLPSSTFDPPAGSIQ
jgi:hypothetical protein